MKQKLIDKIEMLSKEAQSLTTKREQLHNELNRIEVRLHQIAGAITTIDQLVRESEQ